MNKKTQKFTTKHLLILLGIAGLLHIISMLFFINADAPSGGIDAIGPALVYVFLFRIITFWLPIIIGIGACLLWLYHNQRKLFKYAVIIITACLVLYLGGRHIYDNHIRQIVYTPEYAAKNSYNHYKTSSYAEWNESWYGIKEKYQGVTDTPCDKTCEFLHMLLDDMVSELRSANIDVSDLEIMQQYIDAIMKERSGEVPVNITGWKYVGKLSELVSTPSYSDDGEFLLNDTSYRELEEKFKMPLCSEHQYSRYYDSATAQFYSWTSAVIVFYDDGTMDIVII